MAIELVTQFSSYVDEQFSTESKKSMLTNQDFGWDGAHSVKIYKATTAKMNDYDRAEPAQMHLDMARSRASAPPPKK